MAEERFSVCQFFEDGSHEYVEESVNVDQAVEAFGNCVAATSTSRVVVTNGQVRLEWTFLEGIQMTGIGSR